MDVAARARTSKQTISALANHERHQPTLSVAISLEDELAIPVRAWTISFRDVDAIKSRPRDDLHATSEEDDADDDENAA